MGDTDVRQNKCHVNRTDKMSQKKRHGLISARSAAALLAAAMFVAALFVTAGCGGGKKGGGAPPGGRAVKTGWTLPEIPPSIISDTARREYFVTHFWDRFIELSDSCSFDKKVVYRHMERFAAELYEIPAESAVAALTSLAEKAEAGQEGGGGSTAFTDILDAAEHFFFDANSPWRSDDFYLPFLRRKSVSPICDSSDRASAAALIPLLSLNSIGTPAADFPFLRRAGGPASLYAATGEYTVLMFSNPDCDACALMRRTLESDDVVAALAASGRLKLLDIYPDEDLAAWRGHASQASPLWLCGFDFEGVLKSDTMYYLRAIPSLYLLDAERRVLLKDAPAERVISELKKRAL